MTRIGRGSSSSRSERFERCGHAYERLLLRVELHLELLLSFCSTTSIA